MSDIFVPINIDNTKLAEDWRTYTLILGCVSTANVPQLTIDLLVSTLKQVSSDCNVCGYLYSDALMPLSGPDPYTFGGQQLATSCQVFACDSRKLVLVLQRSPTFKELRNNFYDDLARWVSKHNFSRILILSSSFIEHLESAPALRETYPLRYMTSNAATADDQYLRQILNWKAVERVDKYSLQPSTDGVIHLPGSGALKPLLSRFKTLNISPVIALILYCSEGDNRPHAYAFADMINAWLNLVENNSVAVNGVAGDSSVWIEPYSWRNFFGEDAPKSIY